MFARHVGVRDSVRARLHKIQKDKTQKESTGENRDGNMGKGVERSYEEGGGIERRGGRHLGSVSSWCSNAQGFLCVCL